MSHRWKVTDYYKSPLEIDREINRYQYHEWKVHAIIALVRIGKSLTEGQRGYRRGNQLML